MEARSGWKTVFSRLYLFLFTAIPWVAFAAVLQTAFQSFLPGQRFFKGPNYFDYFTILDIWILLITAVFVIGLSTKKIKFNKGPMPMELTIALALITVAGIVELTFQQTIEPILTTPFEYFRSLFIYPMILVILINRTLDQQNIQAMMKSYIGCVIFVSILAITQYLFGIFPGEQYDFTHRLVWPWVDFLTLKSTSANWVTFFVAPAFVIALIKLIKQFKNKQINYELWFYHTGVFLGAIVLYLSQSYGAYAAVCITLAVYFFRSLKLRTFVIVMVIACLAGGGVFLLQKNSYKYKLWTGETASRYDNSTEARTDIYKINFHILTTQPLLGVGLNQYQSYFAANSEKILGHKFGEIYYPPHAHNFFLSIWISLGLFGFAGMLVLIIGIFWRYKFDPANPAIFALLAIMIHGLVDSYYWHQETAYIFWLVIAMIYAFKKEQELSL